MYCSKCGKWLKEENQFCDYCGSPVQKQWVSSAKLPAASRKQEKCEAADYFFVMTVLLNMVLLISLFLPVATINADKAEDVNMVQYLEQAFVQEYSFRYVQDDIVYDSNGNRVYMKSGAYTHRFTWEGSGFFKCFNALISYDEWDYDDSKVIMAAVLLIIAGMMWLANVILAVLSLIEGICAKQCSFSLLWRIVACMVAYLAVFFVHSSLMEHSC